MNGIGKRICLLALSLLLAGGLWACGTASTTTTTASGSSGTTTASTTTAAPLSAAGEYAIDITDLGMPLVFYLQITENDTFQLSNDRTYAVDKGHGTVAHSENTWMLIYSDSTIDNMKTCTFSIEGGNLHFSTTLPYGASNIPASKEDENDPEIIYYLVGKTLRYSEYFGEYAGSHVVSAMGSEVTYEYSLTLASGCEYSFLSEFEMDGESYQYEESGSYAVTAGAIVLSLGETGETVSGTIVAGGDLVIGVKPSEMASRAERTLRFCTTSKYAGTYLGHFEGTVGAVSAESDTVLVLDKFGGYAYEAVDSLHGTYQESGTFAVTGTTLTLDPEGEASVRTGTLANYVLTVSLPVTSGDSAAVSVVAYGEPVQGTFGAEGTDSLENVYSCILVLNPDGTFEITVYDASETEVLADSGTFTVVKTTLVTLVLAGEDSSYSCAVSLTVLQVNVDLNEETVGFALGK